MEQKQFAEMIQAMENHEGKIIFTIIRADPQEQSKNILQNILKNIEIITIDDRLMRSSVITMYGGNSAAQLFKKVEQEECFTIQSIKYVLVDLIK